MKFEKLIPASNTKLQKNNKVKLLLFLIKRLRRLVANVRPVFKIKNKISKIER